MATNERSGSSREFHSKHDISGVIDDEGDALLGDSLSEQGGGSHLSSIKQESWNEPKVNVTRFVSVNLTFVIMGMNDACLGVSRIASQLSLRDSRAKVALVQIEPYYDVNYTTVSLLFVVPFVGYLTAALANNWIHITIGQRGISLLGSVCRLIGYVPMALHPSSFGLLPAAMVFTGLGNGLNDSAWNAWVGNLHNTNELLGLLHGSYGIGGTLAPLLASVMVTKLQLEWYDFFYLMISLSALELVVGLLSFWGATGAEYRKRHRLDEGARPVSTAEVLRKPVPWLMSAFLLGYVGVEVCLGGWIPTFMLKVRHASGWLAGIAVTCFWGGLTVGRVVLGFITGRIGEKLAISIYLGLCIGLEILYWAVPSIEVTLACVILLGFFLGPLFPAAIVVMTKLLPAEEHVASIGIAAAIGGSGAAILPFVVGVLAERKGVEVLQPVVLAVFAIILILWMSVPGGLHKGGLERARNQQTPATEMQILEHRVEGQPD
ncbi:unnamed protein product [Clonostachys chloroleuca]|uniref:Major facilitator superfamily (MFS) profile domain-containing protein n=1 Tax=Clonostachys chloroleuca TaxID=1926264 RepID=A0AA35LPX0_9HYPO|nr:unnamed protein product [Clonostachys chloroleuca]